ncbi:cytochrome b6f subunit family protein [Tumidithrix elongata RA019]|uniref:Cytochrome b6f subunit family protein n=1 Tax=Tumidithrix elongata BACA0141 TaxID=2716417 RepID=A0AAW9PQX3_9CYAN|nr:cytochrome b6f subunit family protein [Tumidithrix elongata RA019]
MKVGQKVRVRSFKDNVSKDVAGKVGEVGVIKEEKIVDGGGWGYIVTFPDNRSTWFFSDELELVAY